MEPYKCQFCSYSSKYKYNLKRHEKSMHINKAQIDSSNQKQVMREVTVNRSKKKPIVIQANDRLQTKNFDSFDIRLKRNFKLFISGPSGSGKTFFITDLLKNLDTFTVDPPKLVIYVYRVWQAKYEEMSVDVFIEDGANLTEKINNYSKGQPTLIVFDDLINSESTPSISRLFTVDGRHSNMSLIFITQKMFVNDDRFREISGNSDYFLVFKNPRNAREIRTLASQMTPGKMDLVNYYVKATEKPFSYLLINLTQQCPDQVKFLSHLFNTPHVVRVYFNSSYLSLHDNHKGNRTNFSEMFLTNEIFEECDCNCQDEDFNTNLESLVEYRTGSKEDTTTLKDQDQEMQNVNALVPFRENTYLNEQNQKIDTTNLKDQSNDEEMKNANALVPLSENTQLNEKNQKVEPLKLKKSLQVKEATPRKIILTKNYEISNKDKPYKSALRYKPYNFVTAKQKDQEKKNNVNEFGGSYSVETWNMLNQKDKKKESGGNDEIENEDDFERVVDLGESMQVDDSEINSPKGVSINNKIEENKATEFQLYDELQCPNCDELFKSKSAIKKHKPDCKLNQIKIV